MYAVELAEARLASEPLGDDAIARLTTIGALLAAAEAVGAAGRMLEDACGYAAERRQFGRTIGSFQALRHLLADMYVRQASSWSSVLYAAAALDEDAGEAARTVSVAKAYVSRAAREVAHGAMQVFGGIAVTAEHPAHRYLRRIVVRERQFGDAAHHERALGRALAAVAVPEAGELMSAATAGFDDPDRAAPGADHDRRRAAASSVRCSRTRCTTRAGSTCDVALISGGKSNLTYRVACDAGEVVLRRPPLGHVLPTAHDMVREHRVLQALEGTAVPVPRVLHLGRRRRAAGRRLLRDGARARPRLPQRAAAGLRRRARGAGGDRRGARRRPRRPARRRPCRGRPRRLRPAGRLRRAPAAPLVAAVGGLQDRRAARARRAPRRARAHAAAAARRGDRPRRLPARQHDPAPDGTRPHRRRPRLGDEHARRPADRPRHAARLLERGDRRRRPRRGARDGAGHGGRGVPRPLGDRRVATPRGRASTSPTSSGTRRSRTSSSPSSARGSRRARPAARCSAPASTRRSGSSRRSSRPAGGCSASAERAGAGASASARQAPDGERPVEQPDRRRARPAHRTAIPPSTLRTWPVTKLLPGRAGTAPPRRARRPGRRDRAACARAGTGGRPLGRRRARRSSRRRRSRAPRR